MTGQKGLTLAECEKILGAFQSMVEDWIQGRKDDQAAAEQNYEIRRKADGVFSGTIALLTVSGQEEDAQVVKAMRARMNDLGMESIVFDIAMDLTSREKLGGDSGSSVRRLNYERACRQPRPTPGHLF